MSNRQGSALSMLSKLVILGLLLGAIMWGAIPLINDGYEDAASVKSCDYVGQEGYCNAVEETKDGWSCVRFGCDGGFCCYCTDVKECFGGVLFMNFAGGKQPMELRFDEVSTGGSDLRLETGTLESAKSLAADGGLSKGRPFTIRYVPQADEVTCEVVISNEKAVIAGAGTKSFDVQDCENKDDFVSLASGIRFNELTDSEGDPICDETSDNTCKVFVNLKTNSVIKESFEVYFER